MAALVRLIDGVTELAGKLCAWIFFAIGLFITYELIVRNDLVRHAFGTAPTLWVDEISRILQVWAAYFAAAYVLKHREMVTIELFMKEPDTLQRKLAESLALLIIIAFSAVAVWFSFELWLKATLAGHTTDSFLAPPKWFTHASVWVGFALLLLQGLAELWKIWTIGIPTKFDDPLEQAH